MLVPEQSVRKIAKCRMLMFAPVATLLVWNEVALKAIAIFTAGIVSPPNITRSDRKPPVWNKAFTARGNTQC